MIGVPQISWLTISYIPNFWFAKRLGIFYVSRKAPIQREVIQLHVKSDYMINDTGFSNSIYPERIFNFLENLFTMGNSTSR